MEDAWLIFEYLPMAYKSEKDQEYINFLWDAFQTNYKSEKYQFAYLAYHMLFMSFVYFTIWKVKNNLNDDFQKALIGFQNDTEKIFEQATSPFVFHKINERTIFRFLKLIGCEKDRIGNYAKMVDDRNDIAHSNGNIFYNAQTTLDEKISLLLKLIDEIHHHSGTIILKCFENFLLKNYDPETREFPIGLEQIHEILIQKNYFSQKDIEICSTFNIKKLSKTKNYKSIKVLYESFTEYYIDIDGTVGEER